MGIDKIKHRDYHYTGIYRGTVTYNDDPDVKGKIKIFVHGVYPDEYEAKPEYLPWAEPAMGLFGGNWTNEKPDAHGNHLNSQVGWCTVPHAGLKPNMGSEVYLFFEHGDINFPVYFAAVQAGEGWFSEHPNQHVFRSDNVHIRIDQNTTDPRSTTKFDSYNQKNSLLSIKDGTKKQTQTRIDIQIQAKQMVAVNLQISGDVNMRQIGDMYIQQEGNRHETLIGNRYVKHIGNTYIEHDGIYISRQKGEYNQQYVEGAKILDVLGNTTIRTYGDEYKEVQGNVTHKFGYTYSLFTGAHFNINVTENMTTNIMKDYVLNIIGGADVDVAKNITVDVGRWNQTQTGHLQITTSNDIQMLSKQGSISLETLGQFDLLNDMNIITSEGYKNLGTKGNITLKSKMGNIGLETVGDSRFEQNSIVVPWNPCFLSNLQLLGMIIQDFDPSKILFTNIIASLGDVSSILNFIMQLPMLAIYDGLPAFLPVKMIAQNPNHEPVKKEDWDAGQYKNYCNAEDNWKNITNTAYWKIIGKVVGNIDIRSWSGDINIKTEGRLGNAGNINIIAEDPVGTLPGYKGGTINIKSKAKKVIYTDPRNMFFDSQNILNRSVMLTHGSDGKVGKLLNYFTFQNQSETAGGCASCIADAFLTVVNRLAPIPKATMDMYAMNIPLHPMNTFTRPNTQTWQKTWDGYLDMGFGHAYSIGTMDEFCRMNHGTINISSDGSLHINVQNNYTLDTNKLFSDKYHFETTVTPNWKYGDVMYPSMTYMPTGRDGVNLGNNIILTEKFGKKYTYSFVHKQIQKVIGGKELMTAIPNTITDANIINYSFTVGNNSMAINEKYNDNWVYNPLLYLDPNSSIKDPFSTPVIQPSPSYTEKYNNTNDYKNQTNVKFTQTVTKSVAAPITINNEYNEQKNEYYKLAIQEVKLESEDSVPIGHTIEKNIGCKAVSNITTTKQGANLVQNFDSSMTDQETHNALLITQQTYNSLLYNLDVKAAAENQSFTGNRVIQSDLVTWAVSHLNFTQK